MKTNKNKIILEVNGMNCANCAKGITKHFENNGFNNIDVNFLTREAIFYTQDEQSKNVIKNIIQKLGYDVSLKTKTKRKKISTVEKYFYITLFFTIPLFCHMFVGQNHLLHNPLIQFTLCLPVYIMGCLHFGNSACKSLKTGIPNMDVLIFMGSSAAFIYSIYNSN